MLFVTDMSAADCLLTNDTVTTYSNDTVSGRKRVYGGSVLTTHHVTVAPTGRLRTSASGAVIITNNFTAELGGTLEIYDKDQYKIENVYDTSGNLMERRESY